MAAKISKDSRVNTPAAAQTQAAIGLTMPAGPIPNWKTLTGVVSNFHYWAWVALTYAPMSPSHAPATETNSVLISDDHLQVARIVHRM
jgi:hypothetical protein